MKDLLHILHLEDNPKDAELVQSLLEDEGFHCAIEVVAARSDFEAAIEKGGLNLILTDYSLPSFDGMTALNLARSRCPDVPFIFVTGSMGEELAIESMKSGATDYVLKQRLSRLVPAVRRALQETEEKRERKRAEENSKRLYEKIREEAEISGSLLEMVAALNKNLDERELLRTVTGLVPKYTKFDRVAIFLYDEELKGFVFSAGNGMSPPEEGVLLSHVFRRGDFPAVDKAFSGDTIVVEDATKSELIDKKLVDTLMIGSIVIAPISFRKDVKGVVAGDYRTAKAIDNKDIALLRGLADGVAVALQNSRLYRESVERMMELRGKIETIKAMSQLDKEILSSIDRNAILTTATALINRIIPCERAAVALRGGVSFRVVSEWGMGRFKDKSYAVKGSHFEIFEANRLSLFLTNISRDECPYHLEQSKLGIVSVLMIPIVTKEGVIGFLDVGSAHYGRLTPEHLSTAENIASQIAVALENARLYEELQQLLINTITSLASAIDAKSPWTRGHSERVTKYAVQIAKELGLEEAELERIRLAGLLHDVGKIGTYDILLDKPERLTDKEFALVKKHPEKGVEILQPIKQLNGVIPAILHHHERYDGKGYPEGLKEEEIPLCARILCVADSFDSMTADRPYRPAPGKEYAISEFKRCSGTQFDPKVVEAFLKVLDRI